LWSARAVAQEEPTTPERDPSRCTLSERGVSRTVASDGEAHDGRRGECYAVNGCLRRLAARPSTPNITSRGLGHKGDRDAVTGR
jgi:hypothetical protein